MRRYPLGGGWLDSFFDDSNPLGGQLYRDFVLGGFTLLIFVSLINIWSVVCEAPREVPTPPTLLWHVRDRRCKYNDLYSKGCSVTIFGEN